MFAYPCATKAIPSIVFDGIPYTINPLDFSLGVISLEFAQLLGGNALNSLVSTLATGSVFCLASIAGTDIKPAENLYVVGDSFLKNWYSIYNYDEPASVRFAKAV